MIDAIAWKFQTGSQWMHLPEKYGNWRGVYNRLRMWAIDGTWEQVFTALVTQADADDDLNWAVSVDSTIVRAHQHAAGARKVERCINRLKQWRGIATRYEKTATIYLAGLHIAGIFLWSAR